MDRARAIVDGNAAGALMELIIFDAEQAHEFLLDQLHEVGLVDDEGVPQPDAPRLGRAEFPGADDLAKPECPQPRLGLWQRPVQVGRKDGPEVGLDFVAENFRELRGDLRASRGGFQGHGGVSADGVDFHFPHFSDAEAADDEFAGKLTAPCGKPVAVVEEEAIFLRKRDGERPGMPVSIRKDRSAIR